MRSALQRDLVIQDLSDLDQTIIDKLIFITPDFGAKALDEFREKYPNKFIFPGISEQLSVDYSYGCSLAGLKPILYGMSPFVTARCFEQFKVLYGQTTLPILLISVGCGLGYDHNTLSHYSLEDIALFSSIPDFRIFSPLTCESAVEYANNFIYSNCKLHLRLERQTMPISSKDLPKNLVKKDDTYFRKSNNERLIIAYGSLALDLLEKTDDSLLIFENLSHSISSENKSIINNFSKVVLIEEAFEHCGIHSRISKVINNNQTLSHFFIKNDIANTKISRNKAREKYLFCGI